jgi:hypothetical protein
MKSFATSTVIQSTPDAIWSMLTDASHWTDWNPTVERVEGSIAPGEKVTVYTKANPGCAFPVKVREFVPDSRMVWTGGMPLGLFSGERTYSLDERIGNGVEFTMREVYSGPMAGMITKSIPDLQPSFDEFASALKRRYESA